ncbi:hypothetical protein BB561_005821 [Smittium simulii]|uniref:Uncharacterized protein n=1 Tax=Smittium simulii TaxID=133385 RepID=A0A2T9Y829_9FUNG|nr:hypothetical protein BB561_005821 [Smittium simulii]
MERQKLSVQSPSLWPIYESLRLYKSSKASFNVGTKTRDSNISIFRRHINTGRDKGNMREESEVGLEPTDQIRLFNPRVQIQPFSESNNITLGNANRFAENVAKSSKEQNQRFKTRSNQVIKYGQNITEKSVVIYRKSTSYDNSFITWALNVASIKIAKNPSDVKDHGLESDARYYRKRIEEFNLVERQANQLEWAIVSTRASRCRNIYRCQRHRMGGYCGIKFIFRILAKEHSPQAHKLKRIISYTARAKNKRSCWEVCKSVFRQHYFNFIYTKIWWRTVGFISGYIRKNLEILHQYKHKTSNRLCSFNPEPSRRTISNVSSNRMVIEQVNIPGATDEIWLARRRLIRNEREYPATELLQLVQEENQKRKNNDDVNNTILAVSNMVPICSANELSINMENNSVRSNPRQNKRKIAVNQKQRLIFDELEHKRKRLQNQGLNKQAIKIITGDSSAVRLQKQYNNIQSGFLNWKNDPLYVEIITASEVVNI